MKDGDDREGMEESDTEGKINTQMDIAMDSFIINDQDYLRYIVHDALPQFEKDPEHTITYLLSLRFVEMYTKNMNTTATRISHILAHTSNHTIYNCDFFIAVANKTDIDYAVQLSKKLIDMGFKVYTMRDKDVGTNDVVLWTGKPIMLYFQLTRLLRIIRSQLFIIVGYYCRSCRRHVSNPSNCFGGIS